MISGRIILKKISKLIMSLLVIIIIVMAAFIFIREGQGKVETQTSTANFSVEDIGELDVTTVFYDKTVSQTKKGSLLGLNVGKDTSLYIFHFKAQVYYDLSKAESTYDKLNRELTVKLPKAEAKLILKDSKYDLDYDYYKAASSIFVKEDNSKGLEVQKQAAKDIKKDILGKKDIVKTAQDSAKKTLKNIYKVNNIDVNCTFSE